MVHNPPQFEVEDVLGTTAQFSGSVGTASTAVPAVAGAPITEVLVRCASDNTPVTKRLLVSFDSGTTWLTLSPGEYIGWGFKNLPTQIYIKGSVASVAYEIVMNREL